MGLTAKDFAEIRRLDVRYCHSVDFGDYDSVASVYAPDAVYENPDPSLSRRGEALRHSITVRDAKGHARHTVLGGLIDGDGNTARSLCPVVVTHDFGPPVGKGQATFSNVIAAGFHSDRLVKLDGRWLFSRRRFFSDWGSEANARVSRPLEIEPVDAGPIQPEMTPLDYEAIKQLLTRYGYTLDFANYDLFADCFTPDGSFQEVIRQDGRPEIRVIARGREQLWEYALSVSDLNYRGRVRNSAISPVIEGDGRRARVSSYAFATEAYGSPQLPWLDATATLHMTGIYRDEVVKVDGHWLFSKRTFRKDTLSDVDALVGKPLNLELFHD